MQATRIWLGIGLMLAGGCSSSSSSGQKSMSQRERDSVIGASKLPGAQGVRGALGATDSAAARNARLDSLANER